MMGRITDGQESIPWATSLLLTTQPCQLHNPHPSPTLLHPLRHFSDTPFHLYCFTPSCCVTQLIPTSSPSIKRLLTSLRPLPPSLPQCPLTKMSCLPKLRPNPLIFLDVVTARAAIPLFLRPFLLCRANGQRSDLRLAATCCIFSS